MGWVMLHPAKNMLPYLTPRGTCENISLKHIDKKMSPGIYIWDTHRYIFILFHTWKKSLLGYIVLVFILFHTWKKSLIARLRYIVLVLCSVRVKVSYNILFKNYKIFINSYISTRVLDKVESYIFHPVKVKWTKTFLIIFL